MDKSTIALGLGLVAILIAIGSFLHQPAVPAPAPALGGVTNYDNIQLTSTGTSTLTRVGCFQGYASSTATPVVLAFNLQGTTSINGGGTMAGMVGFNFGQCGAAPGL